MKTTSYFIYLNALLVLLLSGCTSSKKTSTSATRDMGDKVLPSDNSLLWRISGKDLKSPSYLFGTIHIIKEDDFHVGKNLQKKLEQASRVIMEVDLSKVNVLRLTELSVLPGFKSIKDYLSDYDYTRVRQFYIDSIMISPKNFDLAYAHFKPFYLEQMLYLSYMGHNMQSYEEEFKRIADKKSIPLDGLETMDEQLAVIDEMPLDEQFKSIVSAVKNYDSDIQKLDSLVYYYKKQNLQKLNAYFSDEESIDFTNKLVNNRNKNWIPKISTFIQQEPCFIAVGAGHLGGEKGVIQLLKNEGYTVEPISTE